MRTAMIALLVCAASLAAVSAQDARSIDKLAAKCAKSRNAKDCDKLYGAIRGLTDESLLATLAVESKDPVARKTAIGEMTNLAALVTIIGNERDVDVRRAAIERLPDPAAYARAMEQEQDSTTRAMMAARLKTVTAAGVPVPGLEPLVAPEVLDPASAWEAHLTVGWKVFADAREWYDTTLSQQTLWFWDASGAPKALSVTGHGGPIPAPEKGPFAVVAIEYMARARTSIAALPSLLVGDHFDPAKLDYTAGPGYIDPRPVGRVKWSADDTAYALTNGGRDAVIFYTRNAMSRALWFVPAEDIKKQKFSVFLSQYKPVRFSIPVAGQAGVQR
jgi:hypothetical protein